MVTFVQKKIVMRHTLLVIVTGKQMLMVDLTHLHKIVSLNATFSFVNFIF